MSTEFSLGQSGFGHLANMNLKWVGTDSEENYITHMKSRHNDMIKNGWADRTDIEYKFNEHGFRSESFADSKESIMFLGDSCTFGMGLPLEDSWAYKVSKELKLRRVNLSVPGSPGMTCFRLAYHWIPILKPKVVVYHSPMTTRYEIAASNDSGEKRFAFITPVIDRTIKRAKQDNKHMEFSSTVLNYYKLWSAEEENLFLLDQQCTLSIAQLCKLHGVKFIHTDSQKDHTANQIDFARDLYHAGIESDNNFAQLVLSKV